MNQVQKPSRPKAIVLPFRSKNGGLTGGVGMGLHFLLGNMLILNRSLAEMWFGWRVRKIFPKYDAFMSYCRNESAPLDLTLVGREQKIRYWFGGVVADNTVDMELTGVSETVNTWREEIPYTCDDHLVGFRESVMGWMGACGVPFQKAEHRMALWPEQISIEGLHAFQHAMKDMYTFSSYDPSDRFDIHWFESLVSKCPDSFIAQDLLGWARYRRQEYQPAREAFSNALQKNAAGVGAMAGLMWCGVMTGNEEDALRWAIKKAETRQEDIADAREKTIRLIKKYRG